MSCAGERAAKKKFPERPQREHRGRLAGVGPGHALAAGEQDATLRFVQHDRPAVYPVCPSGIDDGLRLVERAGGHKRLHGNGERIGEGGEDVRVAGDFSRQLDGFGKSPRL